MNRSDDCGVKPAAVFLDARIHRALESVRTFYVAAAYLTIRRSISLIIARMMKPTWLRVRFS
jgi:hypothetical protein